MMRKKLYYSSIISDDEVDNNGLKDTNKFVYFNNLILEQNTRKQQKDLMSQILNLIQDWIHKFIISQNQ